MWFISNRLETFYKKDISENFVRFTEKDLRWSFLPLASCRLESCNFSCSGTGFFMWILRSFWQHSSCSTNGWLWWLHARALDNNKQATFLSPKIHSSKWVRQLSYWICGHQSCTAYLGSRYGLIFYIFDCYKYYHRNLWNTFQISWL